MSLPYIYSLYVDKKQRDRLQSLREQYAYTKNFHERPMELKIQKIRLQRLTRKITQLREARPTKALDEKPAPVIIRRGQLPMKPGKEFKVSEDRKKRLDTLAAAKKKGKKQSQEQGHYLEIEEVTAQTSTDSCDEKPAPVIIRRVQLPMKPEKKKLKVSGDRQQRLHTLPTANKHRKKQRRYREIEQIQEEMPTDAFDEKSAPVNTRRGQQPMKPGKEDRKQYLDTLATAKKQGQKQGQKQRISGEIEEIEEEIPIPINAFGDGPAPIPISREPQPIRPMEIEVFEFWQQQLHSLAAPSGHMANRQEAGQGDGQADNTSDEYAELVSSILHLILFKALRACRTVDTTLQTENNDF